MNPTPSYTLRECSIDDVDLLCSKYHAYQGAGGAATYCFGVYEGDNIVAGYAWQPPPAGAAKSVCPQAPYAVLSLSRMCAVPRQERRLNHVSKPLRKQMRSLIDRTRWPVLLTYSDRGVGHTGHVYKCSGWVRTKQTFSKVYVDEKGRRVSRYSNGKNVKGLTLSRTTVMDRWEHWICTPDNVCSYMQDNGWFRVAIPGKVWKSGNPAFRLVKHERP